MAEVIKTDQSVKVSWIGRKGDTIWFELEYPEGTNLAGYQFRLEITPNKQPATPVLVLTNNNDGGITVTGRRIKVLITAAQSEALDQTSRQNDYSYTLKETNDQSVVRTLYYGLFILNGPVLY